MKRSAKVVASEGAAADAAEAHLRGGGDAIGAAIAGFFAAAGEDPGVLFGALSLLIAQVGLGARAFDGRQRQPGLGVKRPRGALENAVVPDAARVAAPTGLAALSVALRYASNGGLSRVVAPGVAAAKKQGCLRRAALLEAIQRLGHSALFEPVVIRALTAVGRSEGGLLTETDLRAVTAVDQPARVDATLKASVPWSPASESTAAGDPGVAAAWSEQVLRQQGLCVLDSRGCCAALCYDKAPRGLVIEELELVLPLNAVPARRGVRRVMPGSFLPAPAPLSIQLSPAGVPLRAELSLSPAVRATPLLVSAPPHELAGAPNP